MKREAKFFLVIAAIIAIASVTVHAQTTQPSVQPTVIVTAPAAQPAPVSAPDFAAGIDSVVKSVVAVIGGLALLCTAVGALVGVVHVNGKIGAAALLAKNDADHAAQLLNHLSVQVNNHGAQLAGLADTGIGKTIGATLASTTPLQTLETMSGALRQPTAPLPPTPAAA
jgi:hypothetical protein